MNQEFRTLENTRGHGRAPDARCSSRRRAQGTITGRVTAAGQPLPEARVLVIGTAVRPRGETVGSRCETFRRARAVQVLRVGISRRSARSP